MFPQSADMKRFNRLEKQNCDSTKQQREAGLDLDHTGMLFYPRNVRLDSGLSWNLVAGAVR